MIRGILVALVGGGLYHCHIETLLDLRCDICQLAVVGRAIGHLVAHDHVVLRVNRRLHIIAHAESLVRLHEAGIAVSQGDLALT